MFDGGFGGCTDLDGPLVLVRTETTDREDWVVTQHSAPSHFGGGASPSGIKARPIGRGSVGVAAGIWLIWSCYRKKTTLIICIYDIQTVDYVEQLINTPRVGWGLYFNSIQF